jgi:hypothetical protein
LGFLEVRFYLGRLRKDRVCGARVVEVCLGGADVREVRVG